LLAAARAVATADRLSPVCVCVRLCLCVRERDRIISNDLVQQFPPKMRPQINLDFPVSRGTNSNMENVLQLEFCAEVSELSMFMDCFEK